MQNCLLTGYGSSKKVPVASGNVVGLDLINQFPTTTRRGRGAFPYPAPPFVFRGTAGKQAMTLEEARDLIDSVLENIALKRSDHDRLRSAMQLLYSSAKDSEESKNG